jgi:branched-chain amino acid transport system permease protein
LEPALFGAGSPSLLGVKALNTAITIILNGLTFSAVLFLLAAGLTMILGLARISNFAHGSLFVIGAYVGIAVANHTGNWWLTLAVSPLALAVVGLLIERFLLRQLYGKEELLQIILTFGVVLIIEDMIKLIWGGMPYSLRQPPFLLQGALQMGDVTFPRNALFIIAMAAVIAMMLWLLLSKTSLGKQINAAASDMEMADAIGLNVPLLFTAIFVLGSALAGLAGTLLSLRLSFLPALGLEFLIYAFAVVVIGGLGSFKGSIYGSLIVGICYSTGTYFIAEFAMVFIFALLLLTLLIRPRGLFGKVEETRPQTSTASEKLTVGYSLGGLSSRNWGWLSAVIILLFLVVLPHIIGAFWLIFVTELMIMALLASSLNLVLSTGLLSLAQAAFFGTGAYAAGLILIHLTHSLLATIFLSVFFAAVLAVIIGSLSMRHVEIYFSLLTLAFAQFVYTVVFKWTRVTGGDDGLMNIPQLSLFFFGLTEPLFTPDSPVKYYYLVLFFIILSALALRTINRSAFGRVLKGIRQNTERVAFLGLNAKNYRLAAFVIAGAFSGLAGALFAPFQGNISPMAVHWSKSVDPLFMNIIGGMESLVGPVVGSVIFMFFREWLSSFTEYWRIWFGLLLVIITLLLPHGLMGYFNSRLIRFLRWAR